LQAHLQLSEADANALRQHYWRKYGATLSGMMRHHGTDPDHFLLNTHDFPQLEHMVLRKPRLRLMLRGLPGKKIVFSNAPRHYALAVLKLLKIADLFDDVVAVEQTGYRPKPDFAGFRHVLRRHRVNAAQCVMIEDSLENLQAAKRLGMRTVWVNTGNKYPVCVDVKISDVMQLPGALRRVLNNLKEPQ
jgi:putative hydrolase of the HAD superfamily